MIRLFEPSTEDQAPGLDGPVCHVEIRNEILDTRQSFTLPVDVDEAFNVCLPICQATEWVNWHGSGEGEPIAVAVQNDQDSITVRWFATGDPESARECMEEILHGGKGGLLS